MKTFYFKIEQTSIGKGYVSAKNMEEAKQKLKMVIGETFMMKLG